MHFGWTEYLHCTRWSGHQWSCNKLACARFSHIIKSGDIWATHDTPDSDSFSINHNIWFWWNTNFRSIPFFSPRVGLAWIDPVPIIYNPVQNHFWTTCFICWSRFRGTEAVGINDVWLRYICGFIGGVLAGIGGVTLSLANIYLFKETMVSGRGYITQAIVTFGRWNPISILGLLW